MRPHRAPLGQQERQNCQLGTGDREQTVAMVWQQIAKGIAIGSVYALMTRGLTMLYGVLRILHEAHGGIYALGAYVGLYAFRPAGGF